MTVAVASATATAVLCCVIIDTQVKQITKQISANGHLGMAGTKVAVTANEKIQPTYWKVGFPTPYPCKHKIVTGPNNKVKKVYFFLRFWFFCWFLFNLQFMARTKKPGATHLFYLDHRHLLLLIFYVE